MKKEKKEKKVKKKNLTGCQLGLKFINRLLSIFIPTKPITIIEIHTITNGGVPCMLAPSVGPSVGIIYFIKGIS